MRNLNLREENLEKEEPVRISKEEVKRMCKSKAHHSPGKIVRHIKEVYSDGWTKWICLATNCGQVKFTRGGDGQGGKVK